MNAPPENLENRWLIAMENTPEGLDIVRHAAQFFANRTGPGLPWCIISHLFIGNTAVLASSTRTLKLPAAN